MSDKVFRVLVVGDVMMDRYTFVNSTRIAPESSLPVWDTVREEFRLGGAANTAHNLKAIGGSEVSVYLAGIAGGNGLDLAAGVGIRTDACVGGNLMVKHRFVTDEDKKQVFRVDNFRSFTEHDVAFFEMILENYLWHKEFDAVIFSDYDKGTVSEKIVKLIRDMGISPVIVDSKRSDLRIFKGFNVLKVNEKEYSFQVSNKDYLSPEILFDYCVVTKGASGAELRQCENLKTTNKRYVIHTEQFPTQKVNAVDVTGCGDTHTAAMTFSLLKTNGDIRAAVKFANAVARDVVQKFGTSVPTERL